MHAWFYSISARELSSSLGMLRRRLVFLFGALEPPSICIAPFHVKADRLQESLGLGAFHGLPKIYLLFCSGPLQNHVNLRTS